MQKRQTVVTFHRSVIVPRTENMTDEQIKDAAVELYNDPPGGYDDMMVHDGNIANLDHEPFDPDLHDDEEEDEE